MLKWHPDKHPEGRDEAGLGGTACFGKGGVRAVLESEGASLNSGLQGVVLSAYILRLSKGYRPGCEKETRICLPSACVGFPDSFTHFRIWFLSPCLHFKVFSYLSPVPSLFPVSRLRA